MPPGADGRFRSTGVDDTPGQPDLEYVGDIPLRQRVNDALRMRPSALVDGEVRREE